MKMTMIMKVQCEIYKLFCFLRMGSLLSGKYFSIRFLHKVSTKAIKLIKSNFIKIEAVMKERINVKKILLLK